MKTPRSILIALLTCGAATVAIACSSDPSIESNEDASSDASTELDASPDASPDSSLDASADASLPVDAQVGECSSGDTRTCCAARGSQTCGGTGAWGACDVVATAETCNGIDDDCDGVVDQNLRVACVPDQDGDRYAGGTTVTSQCADLGRAAWGNCPAGYVAQASKLGDDCNDADAARYQMLSARIDADADTYCVSAAANVCSGASVPSGYRASASCQSTDDCNDAQALVYRIAAVRVDADGDGYCTAAVASAACIGASPAPGTRLATSCNATTDCKDDNAHATTTCFVSVSSGTIDKICAVGFPVTTAETFTWTCPTGFVTQSAYLLDDNGMDGDTAFYLNEVYSLPTRTVTSDLVCRPLALGHDYYRVGASCVPQ